MLPVAVDSTTFVTVAYDPTRELLRLQFRNHAVYQYFGVPAAIWKALLRDQSKGHYFNRNIRGRFPYVLVSGPNSTSLS